MPRAILALAFVVLGSLAAPACEDVPIDDTRADSRLIAPAGVIEGTVLYQGPHPCSTGGHVVGNVILLFFDQNDPPPPAGLATGAVNFGVVTGDVLFANEPRWGGTDVYCPDQHGVTGSISASAPFVVSPFAAGTYIVQAFFDYTGDFLPTFKFRDLPEQGDVAGGYLDTAAAEAHAGDANYIPAFLPIVVGDVTQGDGGTIVTMPPQGFVADNVSVTMGEVLPLTRPIFSPSGADQVPASPTPTNANPGGDPDYVPVVQMPQDVHIDAPAATPTPESTATFQSKFVAATLLSGVPAAEASIATDPSQPFHFQIDSPDGLFLWNTGQTIPEGDSIPELYPLVVFQKLIDDPTHTLDPQSLAIQGGNGAPLIVVLGITLGVNDSILDMVVHPPPTEPSAATASDHLTALVRPVALCIDPSAAGQAATLVTPFFTGPSSDPSEKVPAGGKPLFDPASVVAGLAPTFGTVSIVQGCLPLGRFAMNTVYPSGQAWTVPNETGSCAAEEGTIDTSTSPPTCTGNGRNVLLSQGTRGVLEITPAQDPTNCAQFPVPGACGTSP